ncbi:MAG: hypothetical protein K0R05_4441, partial [Anaerocolumna sp.]|nr:hypothetical protein [Anaerocolumna sp.]
KIGGHCFFVKKDGVTLENKGFERKIRVSDLTLPSTQMGANNEKNIKIQEKYSSIIWR